MRIHALQHVPFEDPAHIGVWARENGHAVSVTRWFQHDPLPPVEEVDLLVIMGGPMSVHDEGVFSWLVEEKRYIEQAIRAEKPMLGICLGAQLIATVLGAPVGKNRFPEIGWFPVRNQAPLPRSPMTDWLPAELEVFHWHGETFDLPAGAVHLAASDACPNQAFLYDQRVLGLQFHLETTPSSAGLLLANCAGDLLQGGAYVQTALEIQGESGRFRGINEVMATLLGRFL